MAEKTVKLTTIIFVSVASALILTGTGVGIWLGVKNLNEVPHQEPSWSFKISGNIVGNDFNITLDELFEMPSLEQEYTIRSKTNNTDVYKGVQLTHLFTEVIDIDPTAENVTFIAWDGYSWKFSISELLGNDSYILAYEKNYEYLTSYLEDGIGYLYLIVGSTEDYPFNGQRCVKSVVELSFA